MLELVAIGAGGFLGAIARYLLCLGAKRLHAGPFPLGTFAVNVLGCLAIGALLAAVEGRPRFDLHGKPFLVVGLLGSFTTFSTFGHETVELVKTGNWRLGLAYFAGNLVLGLLAVLAGRWSAKFAGV